ncbi:hypothetical protein MSG28_002672 [Choristoneura fumiferana]|uniref:Uncharacterized protein n=2 Tax=Choristoneura fumiferana TaxID=7141 RepID=A0ACC0JIV3_CHOFU|nr:hypothetical protein MSG28_002671 [Choristoneura fumiferana]KAI8424037.1 hypothetical protein MSG28_002672 [Choristoneura fumiferana]
MSSLPFGPPIQVSPLIRGIRFGLLIAGFFYAQGKQALYNRMERAHLEEEARRKVIRDAELAKIKEKIAAEEKENVRLLEQGKLW